jgi:metal-dependent amidase/aminoacylase/carboxypeptidase family protein
MTPEQRKILIEQLEKIANEATRAIECLRRSADCDAKRHMIKVENNATFLQTIRKWQTQ